MLQKYPSVRNPSWLMTVYRVCSLCSKGSNLIDAEVSTKSALGIMDPNTSQARKPRSGAYTQLLKPQHHQPRWDSASITSQHCGIQESQGFQDPTPPPPPSNKHLCQLLPGFSCHPLTFMESPPPLGFTAVSLPQSGLQPVTHEKSQGCLPEPLTFHSTWRRDMQGALFIINSPSGLRLEDATCWI